MSIVDLGKVEQFMAGCFGTMRQLIEPSDDLTDDDVWFLLRFFILLSERFGVPIRLDDRQAHRGGILINQRPDSVYCLFDGRVVKAKIGEPWPPSDFLLVKQLLGYLVDLQWENRVSMVAYSRYKDLEDYLSRFKAFTGFDHLPG